jgi:nucleoside-diphosphate-sugar epimerase
MAISDKKAQGVSYQEGRKRLTMPEFMNRDDKVYVAGHQGLVGSAIWRRLENAGFRNLIGRSLKELDLREQKVVERFFAEVRPDYVFLAAARVGAPEPITLIRRNSFMTIC